MSIRLSKPFRASVAGLRASLERLDRERLLFDLICAAGELAYRLPGDDINLRHVSGSRDPRRRLAREFPSTLPPMRSAGNARTRSAGNGSPAAWKAAGERLAAKLRRDLTRRGDGEYQSLRVLLGYAPTALAPDCVLPTDTLQRVAWDALVGLFAGLFPTTVRHLGPLPCLDRARLAKLRREAAPGLRIGRVASGRRPGAEGRRLAVDPSLTKLVGDALGRDLSPGYQAKYLFYTSPGDHIWPHADDPKYVVNLLACIDRRLPPGASSGSALLSYRPDGSAERHELEPGCALAMESGVVHAREPVRPGEHVTLLSILYC